METFIKMWINQVFTALHFFSVVEKMILIFWYNKTMRIKIISVGKLKEKYLKAGIAEYVKRLSRFGQVEIVELADEKTPDKASEKENAQILSKEGDRILAKLTDRDFVFSMAIEGKLISSEELSTSLEQAMQQASTLVFIIGGSLGLDPRVKKRANALISFGRITLPHQLMRLVLTEQIYRAFMIREGSPYHK
ncbi:50S rRNA methyltransferase [Lactococcus chungangensis CAU 28 = DSM 22330]|uniref:Ribosomal RNA large subunit methyltransferase H n=3 Tax=Pseudolactococcus chungangensis TaxID=451457 RepID=A0ABX4I6L7_9LACT|nr:50S rRNA methyltransferase [Lactococcus chungangensis CAU 28 = DSM 22330]